MPYQGLSNGIYLVCQRSVRKGVDHYGVLDIGNRLHLANADGVNPVVIHQVQPEIRVDPLKDTGSWQVAERANDDSSAEIRFWQACNNPEYNLLNNNCEHFARYVVSDNRESKQLQRAVVVTGLFAIALIGLNRRD